MTTTAQRTKDEGADRTPSPTLSASSVASSRSGTMSRPPPPPKPSHLSCAFTGTVNLIALREYIQAQKTGGSFTSDSRSGTISQAFAGYGYGSIDHFVDAFENSDDEPATDAEDGGSGVTDAITRLSMRKRTYTAPSVNRVFNPAAEDDAGDGTTKLVRKEPIQIDGKGPSKVGNLRNMFEFPAAAEASKIVPQRTGTAVFRTKKVSEKTRMLQAQITGDKGVWSFSPTSPTFGEPSHSSQASEASVMYETAKQNQFERELKKLSLTADDQDAQSTFRLSPVGSHKTPVVDALPTASQPPSTISSPTIHDRDDSSATIKPRNISPHLGSTRRMPSTVRTPSSRRRSRLSSVFSANSGGIQSPSPLVGTPSPDSKSVAGSEYAQTGAGCNERSREPSMLIDHQNVKTSAHMRAHDGSSFDFDWVNRAQYPSRGTPPPSTGSPRQLMDESRGSPEIGSRKSSSFADQAIAPVAIRAGSPPQRPDSIVLSLESQVEEASAPAFASVAEEEEETSTPTQLVAEEQHDEPQSSDETSAGMPVPRVSQPGIGREARALYDFLGEASFNELSLRAGQSFEIVNEELAGGWSLGIVWDEDGLPRRGLIPRGWYCYIQDFTMSPPAAQGIEPPPTPSLFADEEGDDSGAAGLLGLDSPSLRQLLVDSEPTATAVGASPSGGRAMSRIGSISAATSPLASLSSIKASGGTWRQSTTPSAATGAQALEALSNLAAGHGISSSSSLSDGLTAVAPKEENQPRTPNIVTSSHDLGVLETAARANELAYVHAVEPMPSTLPTTSTPARSEATQSSSTAKAEPPASSAVFVWRTGILRGKTLNRFASFVTSGAEEYILSSDGGSVGSDKSRATTRPAPSFNSASNRSDHTETTLLLEGDDVLRSREASSSTTSSTSMRPDEADQHFVVAGRAGPKWKAKTSPFLVQVHSPEKRTKMSGMHEYTVFCVTSTFAAPGSELNGNAMDPEGSTSWDEDDEAVRMPYDPTAAPDPPGPSLTVLRRFTQFAWLYQTLTKHCPALVIPPLPQKQYSGRFAADFIETRRADLELWISRIVRHPVLRYSEAVLFFLSCEDEIEWKRKAGRLLKGEGREGGTPSGGKLKSNMFARTWHPSFNFDAAEAALEGEALDAHQRAMERTMNEIGGPNIGRQGVLGAWEDLREGAVATSAYYRDLSYSLLRLITGAGVVDADGVQQYGEATTTNGGSGGSSRDEYGHYLHGPPMGNLGKRSDSGATNEHGVWCWRDGCHECTNLTYVIQNTAEAIQDVADQFEHHARDALLRQHERLKDISRPHTAHQALLETHRATLAKYREATGEPDPLDPSSADCDDGDEGAVATAAAVWTPQESERIASRCETVLNVTLAEMDRVHDERIEDLYAIGKRFLDSQIDVYETILETLKSARAHYDEEYYDCERGTHILASRFQADLGKPNKAERPLAMPSAALSGPGGLGKVGMLLNSAAGMTRPVSSGFMNGGVAETYMERDLSNTSSGGGGGGMAGSYFLFPNSQNSPAGASPWMDGKLGGNTGTLTATSTLKASQQQQQVGAKGSAGSRTSYFSLWK